MEIEAGAWHVYARGNDRRALFRDDDDRLAYLRLLGAVTIYRRWHTMAYCLMDNHLHLLIETVQPNLGCGMQRLQGSFAQRFNRRHGTTGHVFERRFNAVPITTEEQFLTTVSYIAHNPVAAGLCASAEQWRWGSHAAITAPEDPPDWLAVERLLSIYAERGGDPLTAYRQQVAARQSEPRTGERARGPVTRAPR